MASSRALLRRALVVSALGALAACGGNVIIDQPSGGAGTGATNTGATSTGATGTGATTASSSSSSTGISTSSSSSSSSTSASTSAGQVCPSMTTPHGACSPGASCPSASSPCLAANPQNGAAVFGLRMAHVNFQKPQAFTTGVVQNVIGGAITANEAACNLSGSGYFNWLLQYDTVKSIVTVGGALPVPWGAPYSFVNTSVTTLGGGTLKVTPGILKAPFSGCQVDADSGGAEIVLPLYLSGNGSSTLYLPLHDLQLMKGWVDADHSCVGTYNAAGLDPSNSCNPDSSHPQYIDGAYLSAYIVLAEADTLPVQAVNETLCVLLSGNSIAYGQPSSSGLTVCKKSANGQIVFHGDWCSTTNSQATGACADAVQVFASFAASGVTIQ